MFFKNCFFLSGVFTTFLVSLLANGGSFGQSTPIMAVWDDHDYGVNDGGGDFPAKEISRKPFLDFFNEPMASDQWIQESGIHTAKTFGDDQERVQIIVLDTRWNRSSIMRVTWLESLVHKWNELGARIIF